MFREMLRRKNALPKEDAIEMLTTQLHGTLALCGDGDYPYAVPVNFVYHGGNIFFHCANKGHKLDAIGRNEKVSFCVIEQDQIVPEDFNALYRSTIVFGKAHIVEDEEQKNAALLAIVRKYSKDYVESGKEYIKKEWNNVTVVQIDVEHITAKAGD